MSIEEQIEALTQELRPYPEELDSAPFYMFDGTEIKKVVFEGFWYSALKASTVEAEVEEYADCYKRLTLYPLLGKKAEKDFPPDWNDLSQYKYGTDFVLLVQTEDVISETGQVSFEDRRICVLSGVWFSREEDRLEALKLAGIDKAFQEKCSKFGLGGA